MTIEDPVHSSGEYRFLSIGRSSAGNTLVVSYTEGIQASLFADLAPVDVVLLDQPNQRSLGAGEATKGPTSAAIANGIFAATGLRPRDAPFTAEHLRQLALTSW